MDDVVFTKSLFEFIGTAILVLFGDGVVASNILKKSKGENGGWVVVTIAWGLAVMLGVFISGPYSGAHLNPAVTLGLAAAGTFSWSLVVPYIVAQMLGGFTGAVLVYLYYKDHYDATDDPAAKLATFCTAPAIRNYGRNLFSEIVGTFMLVFVILALSIDGNTFEVGMGALGAFPVAMLIIALGMSLGGTTGYAINPARDLAPRIAHAILPIKGKGTNDWGYSWVPVAGPIIGGFIAAALYCLIYC
ncbi:MIP family channel protein [Barnesiella viscericola DSM 18177]|uniref:MIP family channel protein n=1 Tax=Barnesiella viscericola DSM 18177 TaxID=880074 RepID=W0ELS8_9BACT|nr:MIP/aquaporin family protein [Barnesiella viscericola]AHF11722.1 MIP family channel protein [Barnesiella viscericola DSM 18177]